MRSTPLTHAGPPTPVTVFLIGMTIRKPWRVDAWGSTAHAMTRMITELRANRAAVVAGEDVHDLGFLHAEMGVFARGPAVVQYWASPEHLYAYARDEAREHLPAHKEFYAPGAARGRRDLARDVRRPGRRHRDLLPQQWGAGPGAGVRRPAPERRPAPSGP